MSGILGDYLSANCRLIATADSYGGAEVRRHDLGLTIQREDASTLATALVEALSSLSSAWSSRTAQYRASIAPSVVLETLRLRLQGTWKDTVIH